MSFLNRPQKVLIINEKTDKLDYNNKLTFVHQKTAVRVKKQIAEWKIAMNIKIKEKPANQKKNGKGPDRAHHKRDNWMASKRLKMYSIY